MTGTKICSKCGIEKSFSCFNKDKSKKDGLLPQCKDCGKEYYEQNKEKAKEYYKENKEKIAEKNKEYYEANKEKLASQKKEYQKANKDKVKVSKQRRRARKKSLPNNLTAQQWHETLNDFNFSCANCGNKGNLHLDHFIPLSADNCPGTTINNCIPLCATCNCSKSSKNPKDFFSEEKYNELSIYLLLR